MRLNINGTPEEIASLFGVAPVSQPQVIDAGAVEVHNVLPAATPQDVKNVVKEILDVYLDDISFRIGQAYDVEGRAQGAPSKVYAEDLNIMQHVLTGYTVTANSPSAGSIAWADVKMTYNGTTHSVTNGSATSTEKYIYWDPTTPTTFKKSSTVPTVPAGGTLVFVNEAGTPREVLTSGVSYAVAAGSVTDEAIASGISGTKITGDLTNITSVAAAKVSGTLADSNIPSLSASKITSGTLATAQIPSLDASKIGSGTFGDTRIASGISASKLTGDLSGAVTLATSKLSGTITNTQLAGSISGDKIAAGTISPTNLNLMQHILS